MINVVAFVSVCCVINYFLKPTLCLCFCQQATNRLWCFLPPGETFVRTFQRNGKSPGICHETHFMTYSVRAAPIALSYGLQSYFFNISFGVCPVMNAVYSRRGPINLMTPSSFFFNHLLWTKSQQDPLFRSAETAVVIGGIFLWGNRAKISLISICSPLSEAQPEFWANLATQIDSTSREMGEENRHLHFFPGVKL